MAAMERDVDEQLCDAAMLGDVAGISLALLAGANVNVHEGTWVMTPLLLAIQRNRIAALEALLAASAHVDGDWSNGITPLMLAAANGHAAAFVALLAAGADVHRVNSDGVTALHCACRWGHVDCARALLDAGARTDGRNRDGKRPVDVVSPVLRFLMWSGRAPPLECPLCAGVRLVDGQVHRPGPHRATNCRRSVGASPRRRAGLLRWRVAVVGGGGVRELGR